MFSWLLPKRRPIIVAHRGSSAIAPENTLAAFRQALEDGAHAIELDVHLSKDGEVVVIHDDELNRTTNGHGNVSDYTLKELKRLNAGEQFYGRFSSERIPVLSEVLALCQGKAGINIEIKENRRSHRRYDIVEQCVNIIHDVRASSSVLISSFHHPFLKRVKLLDPSLTTGVLYHHIRHFGKSPVRLTCSTKSNALIMNGASLRKRIVQSAHQRNIIVGEYTVDTERRAERAIRFGIDAIYTNNPAKILKFIASLK